MKNVVPLIIISSLTFSIISCGGDDDSSDSSVQAPQALESFNNIKAPDNFEWNGVKSMDMTVNVVSSFTTREAKPAAIRGKHIINIYSITDRGVDSKPFFTGMTDEAGQISSAFQIPSHWLGIKLATSVRGEDCSAELDLDKLTSDLVLPCNITLDAD